MTMGRQLGLALGLSMQLVRTHSQSEAVMDSALECTVLEFTTTGELRIAIADVARTVRLPGVVVPPGDEAAALALLRAHYPDAARVGHANTESGTVVRA